MTGGFTVAQRTSDKKKAKKRAAKAHKAKHKAVEAKPTMLEVIQLRKKAAKIRKAENRGRPGPQDSEEGSWSEESE
jgi:hypothetical protein